MFISEALAQTTDAAAQGSLQGTLIQLGLIFVIFYVLLIRPQQKKIRQHEAMLNTIKKGDMIVTGGGVYGKVTDASDPIDLSVEIAEGVVVKINRGTVRDLMVEKTDLPKNDSKKKKSANSNKKIKR